MVEQSLEVAKLLACINLSALHAARNHVPGDDGDGVDLGIRLFAHAVQHLAHKLSRAANHVEERGQHAFEGMSLVFGFIKTAWGLPHRFQHAVLALQCLGGDADLGDVVCTSL